MVEAVANNININAIVVKKVLSNLPIISVGFVNNLSTCIKFFTKIISAPNTIKTDKNENNNRFKIKLKLPLFNSFSFLTYLEKSPKFTIRIEKYANMVPVTVNKGNKLFLEMALSVFNDNLNEDSNSL